MHPRRPRTWRPIDLPEAFRLWVIMACVDIRLACLPSGWNHPWIFRKVSSLQKTPGLRMREKIDRLSCLLRAVARFRLTSRTPCLCISLALRHRLAALGLRAELAYGARKTATNGIDAHAWLRVGGIDIDPSNSGLGTFREFLQ